MQQELEDYLSPLLQEQSDTETCAMIALALGMIFVGTAKDSVAETLLQYLITKSELDLSSPFERFLPLALGLVFLGQQGAVEATLEVRNSGRGTFRTFHQASFFGHKGSSAAMRTVKMLKPLYACAHSFMAARDCIM